MLAMWCFLTLAITAHAATTDKWAPIASLPGPTVYPAAAMSRDGRIYIVGGYNGTRSYC